MLHDKNLYAGQTAASACKLVPNTGSHTARSATQGRPGNTPPNQVHCHRPSPETWSRRLWALDDRIGTLANMALVRVLVWLGAWRRQTVFCLSCFLFDVCFSPFPILYLLFVFFFLCCLCFSFFHCSFSLFFLFFFFLFLCSLVLFVCVCSCVLDVLRGLLESVCCVFFFNEHRQTPGDPSQNRRRLAE